MRSKLAIALFLAATSLSTVGCGSVLNAFAPEYPAQPGTPVGDADLPLAITHYAFAKAGSPTRQKMALPLAERVLARAGEDLAHDRVESALAAVRFASMILRVNHVAAAKLSDAGVAVLDRAVSTPAAEGDEGAALGIYSLWSLARPADDRPKGHLASLATWSASPKGFPSPLVNAGVAALRESDAYAYAIDVDAVTTADRAILAWMDRAIAFHDGMRTKQRYEDEIYYFQLGAATAGTRLVIDHLRDGDVAGAVEVAHQEIPREFMPKSLAKALSSAGSGGSGSQEILEALLPEMKLPHLAAPISDAILGVGLAATGEQPHNAFYAEAVVRGLYDAGIGDATPAILAHAILGTKGDPRRPTGEELGRALSLTAEAIEDYAEREMFDAARRTYVAAKPLLQAADEVGGIDPSSGEVETLMGLVEAEAGKPQEAGKLFDEAIAESSKNAVALSGKARLAARDGKIEDARALIGSALAVDPHGHDPMVRADMFMLQGDLARRDGDAPGAQKAYEGALTTLAVVKSSATGAHAAEVARRIASALGHYADARSKEEEYVAIVESTAGADPRTVTAVELRRLARPMRALDAKAAREAFHHAAASLSGEDLVRVAILARAIGRRAGASPDAEIEKTLTLAAAHDDHAGRLAKFALGQIDAATLLAKTTEPLEVVVARFAIAIEKWSDAGLDASRAELDAVAKADVIGTLEADLALDLLSADRAAIPGSPKVAGI